MSLIVMPCFTCGTLQAEFDVHAPSGWLQHDDRPSSPCGDSDRRLSERNVTQAMAGFGASWDSQAER